MVLKHIDLNELSNDVEGLAICTSFNEKVDAVVEVVDVLVDEGLDLLLFIEVLLLLDDLSIDCICQTSVGVRVQTESVTWVLVETETGIVVCVKIGIWVRCIAKIVAVIIFDFTGIMKIV
jgi:hypothetical protein